MASIDGDASGSGTDGSGGGGGRLDDADELLPSPPLASLSVKSASTTANTELTLAWASSSTLQTTLQTLQTTDRPSAMGESLRSEYGSTSHAPRAVVFIGPPKTASTHVQELLANNQDILRTLGWTWPRGHARLMPLRTQQAGRCCRQLLSRSCSPHATAGLWGSRANAKSFANLATALSGQGCSPHHQVKAAHYLSMMSMCRGPPFVNASQVVSFFASEFERVRASSAPNLVFSAEGAQTRLRQC